MISLRTNCATRLAKPRALKNNAKMTEIFQLPSTSPWLRLPPAPYAAIQPWLGTAAVALWPVAVEPLGRSFHESPLFDDVPAEIWMASPQNGTRLVPVLAHAGPEAGTHSKERPLGPEAIVNPRHGRTPRVLDEAGWGALAQRYADAATHLRRHGADALVLSMDDDGLLATTLSPRTHPSRTPAERLSLVMQVLSSVQRTGVHLAVALTVEELCPHGLDPTDGIAIAQALDAQGVEAIVASGGTRSFAPLHRREAATIVDDPCLATAAWLVGRTRVPVWAQGPAPEPLRAHRQAQSSGMAGIVVEVGSKEGTQA